MAVSCKLQAYLLFVWIFCSGFYTTLCSYVARLVLLAMLHEVFYLAMACLTVVCSVIRFANSTLQQPSAIPLGDASATQTVIPRAVRNEPNVDAGCHDSDAHTPTELEPNNGESEVQPEGADDEASDSVACHDFDMARTVRNEPDGDGVQPEENETGDSEARHDFDMLKPAEDEPNGDGLQPGENETGDSGASHDFDMSKPTENEPNGDGLQPQQNETGVNEISPGLDVAQPGEAEPSNDGANHAVDVAPPMVDNVALVQRVLAYSQMEDKALGDRLIFQLAPEAYQRQGLKSVYDRLRWQANPHRHLLGGEYRALAFQAFEHLRAVYHRLEEAQMLASGSGEE
ncbi:hypothetical protein Vafri_20477 [Volvox africanus]|uniref:Uncharacterized protein n=1 Tax=Volvox africanus TaxID=51714 RepID=A0A8J4BRH6_9CHLO|nr:hypothetical protein Vafri_20477 [Volvox africanus]